METMKRKICGLLMMVIFLSVSLGSLLKPHVPPGSVKKDRRGGETLEEEAHGKPMSEEGDSSEQELEEARRKGLPNSGEGRGPILATVYF